ncbi:hypothetical protein [Metapseudomonas resinovorans]|uniref:hypothetical protein n=1 Tax=Metapseudomonas resinovorans TaxID=53412 RepID=UPI00131EC02C|nr:hypothetical protein [Pseudomonas resinovorans]
MDFVGLDKAGIQEAIDHRKAVRPAGGLIGKNPLVFVVIAGFADAKRANNYHVRHQSKNCNHQLRILMRLIFIKFAAGYSVREGTGNSRFSP